jgi:hypothetical protein
LAAPDKGVAGAAIAGTLSNIAPIAKSAAGILVMDMTFLRSTASDQNQLG